MEEAVAVAPHSFYEMITASGPVAFLVLITLFAMSVVSWAVVVTKIRQFKRAQIDSEKFRAVFYETKNFARIDDATKRLEASPLVSLFATGYRELIRLMQDNDGSIRGIRDPELDLEMIEKSMRRTQMDESHRLERGVTFLATVANSAPFIGLFGTVIGIMNAFHGLTSSKNTTLQAVAPGISEALFATAVGLVAAIPAAIAYNYLAANLKRFRQNMDAFVGEFMSVAKRSVVKG